MQLALTPSATSDPAAPLATYFERSLFRRCRFSLFTDRIELRGSRLVSVDFEQVVRLLTLSADVSRVRLRHPWWFAGLLMLIIPYSAFFVLQGGRNLEHGFSATFIVAVCTIAAVFGGVGLWLLVAGFPKREFTVFRNQSGVVTFDVGRVGPERARFDEFVATIRRQGELCRSTAGKPAA